MNANELRIGNYVSTDSGEILRIEGIKLYDFDSDETMVRLESFDKWVSLDGIEPIPLTEEILLKIKGITKSDHDHSYPPYTTYSLNESLIDMGGIGTEDADLIIFYQNGKYEVNGMEVEYLHDLQNIAYYLNNKTELEIAL